MIEVGEKGKKIEGIRTLTVDGDLIILYDSSGINFINGY